jgi:CRP-like cAMP-binding protein
VYGGADVAASEGNDRVDPARLRGIELFASLSDDELGRVARLAHDASIDEGATLLQKGTWAYQLFAIEEGSAEVRRDDETVATLGTGDVVGETGVVQRALRNASVVATSPLRVIFFTQADVGRLSKEIPDLDDRLGAILEQRSR